MGNFKQGGGKRFDRGGGFGERGRGRSNFRPDNRNRVMHQAVCDECGNPCELPFRPTGDKPVYCSSCFERKKETGGGRRGDRFSQNKFGGQKTDLRDSDELKKQLVILNGKMDQLIRAVEAIANIKPTEKKAVKRVPAIKIKKPAKKTSKKKKN